MADWPVAVRLLQALAAKRPVAPSPDWVFISEGTPCPVTPSGSVTLAARNPVDRCATLQVCWMDAKGQPGLRDVACFTRDGSRSLVLNQAFANSIAP